MPGGCCHTARAQRTTNAALPKDSTSRFASAWSVHLGPVVVGDIGTAVGSTTRSSATRLTLRSGSKPWQDHRSDAEAITRQRDLCGSAAGFQFIERGAHLVKGKQEESKGLSAHWRARRKRERGDDVGPDPWFITSFTRLRARVRCGLRVQSRPVRAGNGSVHARYALIGKGRACRLVVPLRYTTSQKSLVCCATRPHGLW